MVKRTTKSFQPHRQWRNPLGVILTPSSQTSDPILSASVGTDEKRATTNDNDAIDADMHARAGDAELILRTTQRQSAVMMVVCSRF